MKLFVAELHLDHSSDFFTFIELLAVDSQDILKEGIKILYTNIETLLENYLNQKIPPIINLQLSEGGAYYKHLSIILGQYLCQYKKIEPSSPTS